MFLLFNSICVAIFSLQKKECHAVTPVILLGELRFVFECLRSGCLGRALFPWARHQKCPRSERESPSSTFASETAMPSGFDYGEHFIVSCLSVVVTGIAAHSENTATFGKGISLGSLGLCKFCESDAQRTPRCNMACMKPRRQSTSLKLLKLLIFLDFRPQTCCFFS